MKKNNLKLLINFALIILFNGCEDEQAIKQNNAIINTISVTTSNVNQSFFYYDLVNQSEIDSSGNWHLALETKGTYNMPSIIFEGVYVAEYLDILFDDMTESPSTFMQDYIQDNQQFEYEGENEILTYDMSSHTVSVKNPDHIYVIYEPAGHTTYKVQFIEYLSGILVFSFSQFSNDEL